ncbi:UDP-N-acetylglucosamine--N-acetylmuramyl-(pentapeptide) pyrophosphoryl-undecaprenol N-acetylglucosamine transferase [Actinomycetospora sp. NBRC 106375]|uniref:undecaprenyldiphospho-muramoylpentapeptide beta-N-acetylglucosaminyltransferase n=1 Tax=Actinomycetospora sp. NBRC 106375 TaxID=3032207 RepID=UPI0024A5A0D6|nr:undecaprenyldiphospho-muramoylpentapeptide beta-N-acetylglucosaminyltransferase [Actinomycetospora sp. NBRC 106375]GLZ47369.1 UDP-N-acetylglucosamine--N-acetylmuramyl-(pentapeptide) pyrophosphoryl-undecaprenol N-acetylglucosamine transferase [Actinomycetospora sp. NBRC 106375]
MSGEPSVDTDSPDAPSVVVAGGGSAGHVEPALATADAVRRLRPGARVTALGTERGLDTRLIPARGYPLELIPPVPLPRKPNADLARLPYRVVRSVHRTRKVLRAVGADVVVGFGGYVALPAYLAAASLRLPIVVHEANARAGIANKVGARFARSVFAAVPGSGLDAEVIGIPLREAITGLDRAALRAEARAHFGLDPEAPVLLVFGGSQGARSLNEAVSAAVPALTAAGVSVLHAHGPKNEPTVEVPGYVPVPYLERMDLAYAAADVALCRAGAMTVAEVSTVGLPAIYVPLPHGNGEQALNARPVVDAGGGMLVADADLTGDTVASLVGELVADPARLAATASAARRSGHAGADGTLARAVLEVAGDAAKRSSTRRKGARAMGRTTT